MHGHGAMGPQERVERGLPFDIARGRDRKKPKLHRGPLVRKANRAGQGIALRILTRSGRKEIAYLTSRIS